MATAEGIHDEYGNRVGTVYSTPSTAATNRARAHAIIASTLSAVANKTRNEGQAAVSSTIAGEAARHHRMVAHFRARYGPYARL